MGFKYFAAYLKHRLLANTRHGTHSPFVYKLADEVIYDFSAEKVCATLEALRKKLLNDDKDAIAIAPPKERKALKSKRLLQLIYRLTAHHQAQNIIEVNTGLGLVTACLVKACPKSTLLSLSPTAEMAMLATQNLQAMNLNSVDIEVGELTAKFKKAVENIPKLDLVFVNGKHAQSVVLSIFNQSLSKVNADSLLIFDQIHANEDMENAWQTIKMNPKVTVTIDLFWIGLVYFREGQAKEHFRLRF